MEQQDPYEQDYHPRRGLSEASSRYSISRTDSNSSTQPLVNRTASYYMEGIQHSATFHPGQDDYDSPYATWVDSPPRISSPEQPQYRAPPPAASVRGPGVGARLSPQTDSVIYTPSTGSSPSASSPPRTESNPIQHPSSRSAYGSGVGTSYRGSNPTIPTNPPGGPAETTQSGSHSAFSRPIGRASTVSKFGPKQEKMQPLFEGQVLETRERPSGYVDTMGYVRRATTTIKRKFSRRYQSVKAEDPEPKDVNRARELQDEESRAASEGYVGVDIDMFSGFDSQVPEQTANAMISHNGNSNFAYTATGEAVDLSTLQGLGAGDDDTFDDVLRRDSFALTRPATGLGSNEKSYYFPPDPDTPNWKPFTMRTIYLTFLQLTSLAIIGFCEYLYQYSVKRGKETNQEPHLTEFTSLEEMPLADFALWKYLPTVIAVFFGVLVQLTDAEVKRTEPYFQLSRKPKGARAADSLNIEYLTFWAILCPLQAIRHKHWAVMISSVSAILSFAAVPPLQSVFLNLDSARGKAKLLVVDQKWTRLLEGVLFLIFILIGTLQWILLRRKTGLVGDPGGIAGVAAMACKSHILTDFRGLDWAGTEQIHKQLNKRTYILHKSSLWQAEFLKDNERPTASVKDQNAHPLLLRLKGGIPLMIYLLAVMVIMPLLMYKSKFQHVLARSTWFLTVLSISIKMLWEVIDRDLRILQPFYVLYRRHAHADALTLDYTGTIPGWIILKTIYHRHFLLTYVTTITLLNEVLTVCMGSLDVVSGEETPRSQMISMGLAEFIMAGQVIGVLMVLHLRRHPFLPRQPGTVSSVLAYIYTSHMLPDFGNMETATTSQRRSMLAAKKKRYGFGWFKGPVDGQWHLGIDQEELLRPYKHGEDFLSSNLQTVPTSIDQF